MFNRVRSIRWLTQAQQSRARALYSSVGNSAYHTLPLG